MTDYPELMTRDLAAGLRLVDGGVTAAQGFRAGNTACGIKSDAGLPDLALLVADGPCAAAATFTISKTASHTVLLDREKLAATGGRAQAVVVNSGNANCSNGEQGMLDARRMADVTAQKLGIDPSLVLVSSTGIIGRRLPIDKVEKGVAQIEVQPDGGPDFAQGIITTDTRTKTIAIEFTVEGKTVRLGGSTKGAGMIYPNMATMLCYITTDAAAEPAFLQQMLSAAVDDSFNMVCVDGDMSTNDTVLLFASGVAGNTPLNASSPDAALFEAALRHVTRYLAREIPRDGEGASRFQTVTVRNAPTRADARKAARAITNSPIWQCAIAGSDPNWGRVIAALGKSGADLDHNKLDISLGGILVVHNGVATDYDQAAAKLVMGQPEVAVDVDLHLGDASAMAWGCDLTHGYIEENAE
ncbi:MAG TPA: bifunctional glutamate N-acetyltransferase/amino-acid acetyltransferase ArgJ, partial [Ktedonobacterales bacterium]|nr:bifunctional glutamate N-acetyltransferase/amino-acid acetyltransferase ArgJ [Ktedonobacterales bacterium]